MCLGHRIDAEIEEFRSDRGTGVRISRVYKIKTVFALLQVGSRRDLEDTVSEVFGLELYNVFIG